MEFVVEYFLEVAWQDLIFASLRILLVVVIAWLIASFLKSGLRRLEKSLIERGKQQGEVPSEASKRAETLVRLLRQAMVIMIWVVSILVILNEFGLSIAPIIASAGVVGLAVGFGAQNLVRDVISGFFLILENQVRVGDVAVVNGTGGLVESINFRTLQLRDLEGKVHIFPNGSISSMTNLTYGWSAYVFDIPVAYKENTDRVVKLIEKVGQELRDDPEYHTSILDDIEIFGVDKFDDSGVIIKGRIRTLPIKQWFVGREFLRRIKLCFDDEGIEIPFPHRTLYLGQGEEAKLTAAMLNREQS
ncbi:small conductance mechanosensitive channel [Ectothiorhodosinus mongolicus]|uniref:Small conductance mechanosensitive channel n=1 Tax=Ectothiorhodosinus mongolicus TaxID=233100 RepID=A0A1R3VYS0_9GAMM|nr:mechanosensitive ion channel family protein [Ectothiorhodosinus mongolicus]ULX56954.1 mechanosensitive ion channel family protein [Ectothiorhodosinus mongolicus]SIT69161.1 small conductance mechanosensitive channel [Ectothiorhodosinus mongolicus]